MCFILICHFFVIPLRPLATSVFRRFGCIFVCLLLIGHNLLIFSAGLCWFKLELSAGWVTSCHTYNRYGFLFYHDTEEYLMGGEKKKEVHFVSGL